MTFWLWILVIVLGTAGAVMLFAVLFPFPKGLSMTAQEQRIAELERQVAELMQWKAKVLGEEQKYRNRSADADMSDLRTASNGDRA